MFDSLPAYFRKYGLTADVKTLLLLRKSLDKGLVRTLGDMYNLLKGIVTNDPKDFGPYTTAFYDYFLNIQIKKGETLESAVIGSKTFKDWKAKLLEQENYPERPDINDLIERFLDAVHFSTFDIKRVLSGKDLFNKNDPNRTDTNENAMPPEVQDKAADYRELSLDELKERFEKVEKQQKGKHSGGGHWIGQHGYSAFGNNGAAMGGMRMEGSGGGKMARMVVGNAQFYPIDKKMLLKDNNIDVALATLKGIEDESAHQILDISKTIKEGLKQGGIFIPYEREKIVEKVQVILLIDNGGLSMIPYVRTVTKLFSKMKHRFAHDLKTYYYHNTIYGGAYADARRVNFVKIEKILKHHDNYSVFIIGDADMAPEELTTVSYDNWKALKKRFPRIAWLNPMSTRYWTTSDTVPLLRRAIPMYPLTPEGVEKAVAAMNKKRKYMKKG